MKKFLTKIMFAAVAVLSVAGFSSCNNADDDPIVAAPAAVQDQPKYEEIPSYVAILSDDLLDMYDITLVLHSGAQSKEVALTKANGETKDNATYKFVFSDIDGQKGISRVEAKVTPKADAKTFLENMPAEEDVVMVHAAGLFKASYDASGKLMNQVERIINTTISVYSPSQMLVDMGNGTLAYEYNAETLAMHLTR